MCTHFYVHAYLLRTQIISYLYWKIYREINENLCKTFISNTLYTRSSKHGCKSKKAKSMSAIDCRWPLTSRYSYDVQCRQGKVLFKKKGTSWISFKNPAKLEQQVQRWEFITEKTKTRKKENTHSYKKAINNRNRPIKMIYVKT